MVNIMSTWKKFSLTWIESVLLESTVRSVRSNHSHLEVVCLCLGNNSSIFLQVVDEDMGESEACFLDLIRTLISNPEKREHFFQVTNTKVTTHLALFLPVPCN